LDIAGTANMDAGLRFGLSFGSSSECDFGAVEGRDVQEAHPLAHLLQLASCSGSV